MIIVHFANLLEVITVVPYENDFVEPFMKILVLTTSPDFFFIIVVLVLIELLQVCITINFT